MIVNPSTLDALYYNFRLDFQGALDQTPIWHEQVATTVPSGGRSNIYAWAKRIPALREWVGERVVNNLEGRGYQIINKKFEDTVEVSKDDVEDDNLGMYSIQVKQLGEQSAKWPDYTLADMIAAGTTNLAFDGQPFFSASHPVDMSNAALSTYSNLFATTALTPANYQAVRVAMMSYKGEDNKPLNVMPDLLVVPPQLEATAKQILNADFIVNAFGVNSSTGSQTNVLKGSANILVLPELLGEADAWYLLATKKVIKPFVWQLRSAPMLTALTAPTSENVFWRSSFVYGVDARGNAGYTLPFLAARAKA